jgi:hypothetical protein
MDRYLRISAHDSVGTTSEFMPILYPRLAEVAADDEDDETEATAQRRSSDLADLRAC